MSMFKKLFRFLFPGYSFQEFLEIVVDFRQVFYALEKDSQGQSDVLGQLLFRLDLETFHRLKNQILEVTLEHPEFVKTYVSSLPHDVWQVDPVCIFLRQSLMRKPTLFHK